MSGIKDMIKVSWRENNSDMGKGEKKEMKKEEFDGLKIGMRVGFVYGPGEFPQDSPGTIIKKEEDYYGFHIWVKTDEGHTERIETLTTSGAGLYVLTYDQINQIGRH